MASGGAEYQPTRILVKNVPCDFSRDKLEIYFQKSKNGGNGDVASITVWFVRREEKATRQAVIEFESAETVKSVLAKKHQISRYQLEIQPFPEQVFGLCDVLINKSVSRMYEDLQGHFSSLLQHMTGVVLEKIYTNVHVKGHWYQIEAAKGWIDWFYEKRMTNHPQRLTHETFASKIKAQTLGVHPPKQVPAQSSELPVDEQMFKYYQLCYPEVTKNLTKKYKVSMQCNEGKIIFYPMQKGVKAQTAAALEAFKPPFFSFCAKVKPRVINYSKFPLGNVERDESIKVAMAKGKVFVSCDNDVGDEQIKFFGLTEEDLDEAVDIFRTECMPSTNTILASFAIDGKAFKVTVIHGDFQQQKGDALLSEMNEKGDSKIPLQYLVPKEGMEASRALMLRLIASNRILFESAVVNEKVPCKWLQYFVVGLKENGKTNFKNMLARAIESVSIGGGVKAVLPLFKDNGCNVSSCDFMGMVAGAIRIVNSSARFSDIYIVHNNNKEARSLVQYFISTKKFNILKTDDSDRCTSPTKSANSSDEDVCSICLDELNGAVSMRTLPCQHTFHQACIDKAFSISMKCPLCMRFYGKPKGNQPKNGTMTTRVLRRQSLPGYKNCAIIEIGYNFPSGMQGAEHPNPGSPYHGTSRVAYLPDNEEGRELLLLLRKAFEARITFTVGRSVTTGRDNVVTWNDIHHKTNISGGPQAYVLNGVFHAVMNEPTFSIFVRYGYPDPTYLSRLKMELADKGITLS